MNILYNPSNRWRTLSHKKRLLCQSWHLNPHCQRRHGVNGLDFLCLGWGGDRIGTLDDSVILCQKSRLQICPPKNMFGNKQSATDGTKPHLNWFPGNLPPWKWRLGDRFDRWRISVCFTGSPIGKLHSWDAQSWVGSEPTDLKNGDYWQFQFNSPVLRFMFQ